MPDDVRFQTIDLERHANVCVAFRRDSFVCSFGSDERFVADHGPDGSGYLAWLKSKIELHPRGHVHVWREDSIIGQIEMRVLPTSPISGHVNLYYLVPKARGSGVAAALQQYTEEFFRQRRAEFARLRVSPTNARAFAFYRKHGWRDLGLDPEHRSVHVMELDITRAGTTGA